MTRRYLNYIVDKMETLFSEFDIIVNVLITVSTVSYCKSLNIANTYFRYNLASVLCAIILIRDNDGSSCLALVKLGLNKYSRVEFVVEIICKNLCENKSPAKYRFAVVCYNKTAIFLFCFAHSYHFAYAHFVSFLLVLFTACLLWCALLACCVSIPSGLYISLEPFKSKKN